MPPTDAQEWQNRIELKQLLWIARPDGVLSFVSPELAALLGRSPKALTGRHWKELIVAQDRDAVPELDRGNPDSARHEVRLRQAADGSERWHSLQLIDVGLHAEYRWRGIFTDIHQYKLRCKNANARADRLGAVLEGVSDALFLLDPAWRFVHLNKEAERLLLRPRDDLLGKVFWTEFGGDVGEFRQHCKTAVSEERTVEFDAFYPPRRSWYRVRASPSSYGLTVHLQDISDQRRIEMFRGEQSAILQKIAAGAPLPEVLHAVVQLTEMQDPLNVCSVLLKDEEGRLRVEAAPNLPADYNAALTSVPIAPDTGSCGTAAHLGQVVVAGDIATDARWEGYRELALRHGLRACWSVPISSGSGEIVGTFAVYSAIPRVPKPAEIEMLLLCAQTIGIAVERQRTTRELIENERRFRELASLLDRASDAIFVRDMEGRISFWNRSAERSYGWKASEAVGRLLDDLLHDDDGAFDIFTEQAIENGEWSGELTVHCKEGTRTMDARWTLVRDAHGNPQSILAIASDLTQRKAAEQQIHRLAFYDLLTQLPNRQLLLDRLKHALSTHAHNRQLGAVMFLDLDNFKTLNDTQGHEKGDLLLKQVAKRLNACVREYDTVARWGGDEFVIILEDLGSDPREAATKAETVAEKIIAAFPEPFDLQGTEYRTTPSLGITLFSAEAKTVDELLKQADLAMYQAKAAGRNTVRFFDAAMQAHINARVRMEEDLRQGLENKEFVLYYQPQVEGNGEVMGVEALVRWAHPRRGTVSPSEFIPLAEETGMIHELGQWILESACEQLVAWEKQPQMAGLTVAVNVSARQFQRDEFVAQVLSVIQRTGADPRKLKIELTESLLISDVEQVIEKIRLLRMQGIGISLDDFGTGYSSLAYLKRLPLDQLKIDQAFVRDVLTDKDDAAIVTTIISLGKVLGFKVISEGVETQTHHDFLSNFGCDAFQGYLFSKPLPADQLYRYISHMH